MGHENPLETMDFTDLGGGAAEPILVSPPTPPLVRGTPLDKLPPYKTAVAKICVILLFLNCGGFKDSMS